MRAVTSSIYDKTLYLLLCDSVYILTNERVVSRNCCVKIVTNTTVLTCTLGRKSLQSQGAKFYMCPDLFTEQACCSLRSPVTCLLLGGDTELRLHAALGILGRSVMLGVAWCTLPNVSLCYPASLP